VMPARMTPAAAAGCLVMALTAAAGASVSVELTWSNQD
jgi:hypothetical protein